MSVFGTATLASASANPATPLPSIDDAKVVVEAAEQHLSNLDVLEREARERLDALNEREAELARQIAVASAEVRRWTMDAYTNDRLTVAALLVGNGSAMERSARVTYAQSAAAARRAAIAQLNQLIDQATPEIVAIGQGLEDLQFERQRATEAVFAARAQEAEAERRHAEAEKARLAAQAETQRKRTAAAAVAQSQAPGVQGPPAPVGGPTEEQWARLRHCESTGNYQAVSKSGKYRGAYQFDRQTWATLGPPGDPAAASPEEQDRRARLLYAQRGWRPWPHCGRHLR